MASLTATWGGGLDEYFFSPKPRVHSEMGIVLVFRATSSDLRRLQFWSVLRTILRCGAAQPISCSRILQYPLQLICWRSFPRVVPATIGAIRLRAAENGRKAMSSRGAFASKRSIRLRELSGQRLCLHGAVHSPGRYGSKPKLSRRNRVLQSGCQTIYQCSGRLQCLHVRRRAEFSNRAGISPERPRI